MRASSENNLRALPPAPGASGHNAALQELVARISTRFVNLPGSAMDGAIRDALAAVGERTGADRSFLFLLDREHQTLVRAQDWHSPDVTGDAGSLRVLPMARMGWWMERLGNQRIIEVNRLEDLPAEARAETELLRAQGIRSVLVVPMVEGSDLVGFCGLAALREATPWPEGSDVLLRIVTDVFANALARRRSEQALQTAESRLRTVFDGMGSAVLVADHRGIVLMANQSAIACLKVAAAGDLVGRPLAVALPGSEPMLRDATPAMQQQVTLSLAGQKHMIGFTSTITPENRQRIVVFRDVTRVIDIENRRQRAEQLAQVGEVAAKVSHEIRNPLASILMGLQTLERQVFLSSEDNLVLQQVIDAVRSLGRVITGLLDSARLQTLAPQPMRVEPILRDCRDSHAAAAAGHGVDLHLVPGPVGTSAVLDELAMVRIVGNLVRNSIEACDSGCKVSMGWRDLDEAEAARRFPGFAGPVAAVWVDDTGPGIDPMLRDSMFDPFVTTKGDGTGLGLSVVQELVQALGGTIDVECGAHNGRGTRFEIYLPAGERRPCWELRHEQGIHLSPCKGPDSCPDGCPAADSHGGYVCWTIMGKTSQVETGEWPIDCRHCPAFKCGNLAHYVAPGGASTPRP